MRLYQRLKRQILSRVYLVRMALVLAILAGAVAVWATVLRPLGPVVTGLWRAVRADLPTQNGRTNFLVLGREGTGSSRAGADLTDTLILVSVHQSGNTVLVSIPRDLWVPSLRAKINSAYYYGEQRKPGMGGTILAKAAVEETIGQPVHFALVIDFVGFEKLIDLLGGVDVDVARSFVDRKFPLPGRENDDCDGDVEYACRYETISFAAGRHHLDSQTALKYVRSRQAEGEEGSDFARSQRQERLLLALKDKLLSPKVLANPRLLAQLAQQVSQIVVTDVESELYPTLIKLGLKAYATPVRSISLTEPEWVYHPPVSQLQDWQWVLLPTDNLGANVKDFLTIAVQK